MHDIHAFHEQYFEPCFDDGVGDGCIDSFDGFVLRYIEHFFADKQPCFLLNDEQMPCDALVDFND